jgi:hypothetical protein
MYKREFAVSRGFIAIVAIVAFLAARMP